MQCRVRDWSTARRSLYCPPSRRLWAKSGRRPRSEAGSVAPRAKKNKKRTARVGESFSRDRALLRSAGASQAHYVSRLRFATLRKEPLLACQDLGIEVYFMLFRILKRSAIPELLQTISQKPMTKRERTPTRFPPRKLVPHLLG